MTGLLLKHNSFEPESITPQNGETFSSEELQRILDCDTFQIDRRTKRAGWILIFDEEGKMFNKPVNDQATDVFDTQEDYIVGHAIYCPIQMLP